MGKLHTLRRAINRNPKKWRDGYGNPVRSATWNGHEWYPAPLWSFWRPYRYRKFIEHVLKTIAE